MTKLTEAERIDLANLAYTLVHDPVTHNKLDRLLTAMKEARGRGDVPQSDLVATENFIAEAKARQRAKADREFLDAATPADSR